MRSMGELLRAKVDFPFHCLTVGIGPRDISVATPTEKNFGSLHLMDSGVLGWHRSSFCPVSNLEGRVHCKEIP